MKVGQTLVLEKEVTSLLFNIEGIKMLKKLVH
jgi:hypothetical protein